MNFRQIVTVFGNKSCPKQQLLLPFSATFVAVFGDYSFGYNLLMFSATFVAWCGQAITVPALENIHVAVY